MWLKGGAILCYVLLFSAILGSSATPYMVDFAALIKRAGAGEHGHCVWEGAAWVAKSCVVSAWRKKKSVVRYFSYCYAHKKAFCFFFCFVFLGGMLVVA